MIFLYIGVPCLYTAVYIHSKSMLTHSVAVCIFIQVGHSLHYTCSAELCASCLPCFAKFTDLVAAKPNQPGPLG